VHQRRLPQPAAPSVSLGGQRLRAQLPFMVVAFAPIALVLGLFWLYPLALGLWGGFTDWRGFVQEQPFVGLRNYRELLNDRVFLRALQNSASAIASGT